VLDWSAGRIHAWRGRLWLDPGRQSAPDWRCDFAPAFEVPSGGRLIWHGPAPESAGRWHYGPIAAGARLARAGGRQPARELLRTLGVPPWRRALWPALYHGETLLVMGAECFDADLERWMKAHGSRLEWHRRPVGLLPFTHSRAAN